jgi:undecaprenyl-diphosphatase
MFPVHIQYFLIYSQHYCYMFLDIIKAIILGLVEGITEFLPISSTGHLIILNNWLSFSQSFTAMFDVVIQLGAILAVLVIFWKKLWPLGKDHIKDNVVLNKANLNIWYKVIVAVAPALVLGALFGSKIEDKLFNSVVVAIALIVGGVILILVEKKQTSISVISTIADISYSKAFCIGLVQCLAMIPGTSRSAATIIGAVWLGASRAVAVEFSFFLAIPTMLAASAYSALKHGLVASLEEWMLLAVGFVVAFWTALVVIKFLLRYIQNHNFKAFGYYRIILGLIILLAPWIWSMIKIVD